MNRLAKAAISTLLALSTTCTLAVRNPNIIIIYTDDQGYGDVSALNQQSKFKTPNIDRLANEGIVFTNGHSPDAVCTPSRYGLLTGRYPWRTINKRGVFGAEAKCLIEDGRMTLAYLLKENGYSTGMVGKWHLGMDFPGTFRNRDWAEPIQDMPLDKGFDYFFGIPASLNFGILAWFEGRYAIVPPTMYTKKKENDRHVDYRIMPPYMSPDDINEIKSQKLGIEVAPDFVDNQCLTHFTNKAIEWMSSKVDDTKNGKPFFLYLPYTSPHYPVCPVSDFEGQGECGAYGEFVIETDYHIGRILQFLEDNELDENTLIVFTSDNGPEVSWAERITEFNHDSKGGLREGKRSVYEGGHRVPFIVRWPAGIVQPGRRWDKIIGQVDLLATFADLLGVTLPENAGEDSQSFASVLLDPHEDYNRIPLITHGNGAGEYRYAITDDNWKLILPDGKKDAELYDLSVDRAEVYNIVAKHPETVGRLTEKIGQIIAKGRSTPGLIQSNDTAFWEDLKWMDQNEYNRISNQSK